jgi:hypothetical protein
MTVAENVALLTGYPRSRLGLISWRRLRDTAAARFRSWAVISIPTRG